MGSWAAEHKGQGCAINMDRWVGTTGKGLQIPNGCFCLLSRAVTWFNPGSRNITLAAWLKFGLEKDPKDAWMSGLLCSSVLSIFWVVGCQ